MVAPDLRVGLGSGALQVFGICSHIDYGLCLANIFVCGQRRPRARGSVAIDP
jgi:hypothetical protein